jgi:hypothetical protein
MLGPYEPYSKHLCGRRSRCTCMQLQLPSDFASCGRARALCTSGSESATYIFNHQQPPQHVACLYMLGTTLPTTAAVLCAGKWHWQGVHSLPGHNCRYKQASLMVCATTNAVCSASPTCTTHRGSSALAVFACRLECHSVAGQHTCADYETSHVLLLTCMRCCDWCCLQSRRVYGWPVCPDHTKFHTELDPKLNSSRGMALLTVYRKFLD